MTFFHAGKNQPLAYVLAVGAVVLFAYFESRLGWISDSTSIPFYLGFRLPVTAILFGAMLYVLQRTGAVKPLPARYLPWDVDSVIWLRAGLTTGYLAALAFAFSHARTQASVYPFFFLHPLWQMVASRHLTGKSPAVAGQVLPIVAIMIGVVIYSLAAGGVSGHANDVVVYVYAPALVGGLLFAYCNELSGLIANRGQNKGLKCFGGKPVVSMSSLHVTLYTTYAGVLLLPVSLPFIEWAVRHGATPATVHGHGAPGAAVVIAMVIGCVVIAAATWAFAEAFARSSASAPIAAIDCLILPVGAILDWASGKLDPSRPHFGLEIAGMAVILLGAVWSAFAGEIYRKLRSYFR